jgi:hypothetical protein
MSVAQINSETLLEFIARVGTVNTDNVQQRFGWDNRRARYELRCLVADEKLVETPARSFSEEGHGGKRCEWRLA